MKLKQEQANVFTQIIYYLKKFEENGRDLPPTLFVGDKDECFAFETKSVEKFLKQDIDWSIAPSDAHNKSLKLVQALVDDVDLLPYVFQVDDEKFNFREVIDKIKTLSEGIVNFRPINKINIVEVFDYWQKTVLIDNLITVQQQVDAFIKCLIDRSDTYIHPNKPNILVIKNYNNATIEIRVDEHLHNSFFNYFKKDYTPSERKLLVECKDRLVEEIHRRRTGEFFTPTIWAAEAHCMIGDILGEKWFEKYVVWNCASGTNNLTRDLHFKSLYCSTLNQEDIDTVKKMNYNPEAIIFQFDFLNDDLSILPPELIRDLLANRPFLFLLNPPYATQCNQGDSSKQGATKTKVNEEMLKDKLGKAAQQLYAQFLYRIIKIKNEFNLDNVNICIFSKPTFITGPDFQSFRKYMYENFRFVEGMLFNASNFSDVSSLWGVSFTIWEVGKNLCTKLSLKIKEVDSETFKIKNIGSKMLYNSDNKKCSDWVKEAIKGVKTIDNPQMSTAINAKQSGVGKIVPDALAYMHNNANSVQYNNRYVGIYSTSFSGGHGFSLTEGNLMKAVALFTARKCTKQNWIDDKDEYLIPNTIHKEFKQWNNDTLIYSLFNGSSNQSSLRNINYKGKLYNIRNQFFFMSNAEMKQLANKYYFDELYYDCEKFTKDPYILKLLYNLNFSVDACIILDKARKLVSNSMKIRREAMQLRPEYHLQSWDAGWYQIKNGVLRYDTSFSKELDEFYNLYQGFEERMKEGVYKFNFLLR